MIDDKILDYIKRKLQEGVSKEDIKKSLLASNWQESDIDGAFEVVSSTPSFSNADNKTSKESKIGFKYIKGDLGNIGNILKFLFIGLNVGVLFNLFLPMGDNYNWITVSVSVLVFFTISIVKILKPSIISHGQISFFIGLLLLAILFPLGPFVVFAGFFTIPLVLIALFEVIYAFKHEKEHKALNIIALAINLIFIIATFLLGGPYQSFV